MPIKLRLKHSSTANKAPLPTDLVEGELALNTNNTSPAAYIKDSAGAVVKLAGVGSISTPDATETAKGIVELATAAETTTGTDATRAVHPAGLKVELDKKVKLAGDTMTGNLTVPSLNGGPLAGFRNAIINGNFDIWQRGTSFTANEYGADRWYQVQIGTTHTGTRQSFTLGQTAVPGEPKYFCRTVVTSVAGAANQSLSQQRIEDVRTFAGQQVTVSFWAKVDATKNISVEFAQVFGSGGTPSALVPAIGTTKVSIGTSWQKVTVTATVPSISGKTLGTSNDSTLNLNLWFDAGSSLNSRTDTLGHQSGTFDIAQVQIEPGPVATPFERRPIGTEFALCQRFYQIRSSGTVNVADLRPTMRAAPTIAGNNYDAEL